MSAFYQSEFPTEFELHRKYAPVPLLMDLVWTQGCIVADICNQLLQNQTFDSSGIDAHLLTQAALLHDIGVYESAGFEWMGGMKTSAKPYIQHSIVGAWMLLKEGYPPEVVQAAYAHKGAGITTADITRLGLDLPLTDYVPTTNFHKLICYAGKYHSKAPKWRSPEEIVRSLGRYGSDKAQIFAEWYEFFGPVDLEPLKRKYQEWHGAVQAQINQLQGGATQSSTLTI